MNWDDRGVALAVSDDPASDIADGCIIERPKVVFCPKTGTYSMFFHLELKGQGYTAARVGIATAARPEGPFRFLRSLRPNGAMSRDMTLFVDDDGKAYHVFSSEENQTTHVAELTDDFLDYTGKTTRLAVGESVEAQAVVKANGRYWLVGLGCTGWAPNKARLYRADKLEGPWTRLGNPCRGIDPATGLGPDITWGCQSTFPAAGCGSSRRGHCALRPLEPEEPRGEPLCVAAGHVHEGPPLDRLEDGLDAEGRAAPEGSADSCDEARGRHRPGRARRLRSFAGRRRLRDAVGCRECREAVGSNKRKAWRMTQMRPLLFQTTCKD